MTHRSQDSGKGEAAWNSPANDIHGACKPLCSSHKPIEKSLIKEMLGDLAGCMDENACKDGACTHIQTEINMIHRKRPSYGLWQYKHIAVLIYTSVL